MGPYFSSLIENEREQVNNTGKNKIKFFKRTCPKIEFLITKRTRKNLFILPNLDIQLKSSIPDTIYILRLQNCSKGPN